MKVIWKDIPGCEGSYQASNTGLIRSLDRYIIQGSRWGEKMERFAKGRILAPSKDKNGYWHMGNKSLPSARVARLIALTFIPNPDNKPQVNHKNGIITDDKAKNLEWCTSSENAIHAFEKLGRKSNVNEHQFKTTKITNAKTGKVLLFKNVAQAAKKLGVGKTAIMNAAKGPYKCQGYKVEYV